MSNSLIANSRGLWFIANYDVASSQSEIILSAPYTQVENYLLYWDDVTYSITSSKLRLRVTKSGSTISTGNYDFVQTEKHAGTPATSLNQDGITMSALPTATNGISSGIAYIYNLPLAQNDYFYFDEIITGQGSVDGNRSAATVTLQTASDGISISCTSGTIETGKFRLYGYGLDS
jgi:hypothetical protein